MLRLEQIVAFRHHRLITIDLHQNPRSLVFTHYCGKRRSYGTFIVWRKTAKKRMAAKLHAIKAELVRRGSGCQEPFGTLSGQVFSQKVLRRTTVERQRHSVRRRMGNINRVVGR